MHYARTSAGPATGTAERRKPGTRTFSTSRSDLQLIPLDLTIKRAGVDSEHFGRAALIARLGAKDMLDLHFSLSDIQYDETAKSDEANPKRRPQGAAFLCESAREAADLRLPAG